MSLTVRLLPTRDTRPQLLLPFLGSPPVCARCGVALVDGGNDRGADAHAVCLCLACAGLDTGTRPQEPR